MKKFKINFGKTWWFTTLSKLTNLTRKRVRHQHKNADGEKFADYSEGYKKVKSEGKAVSSGMGRRKGESQQSYSTTPDMTLTGRTLGELQATDVDDHGGNITFPTQGNIVRKLSKRKNYKIYNVGEDDVLGVDKKFINKEFDKKMKKELEKNSFKKTINVKI